MPTLTEDLKEAFSGDRGKVLLIGGAAALAVIWWTRQTGAPQGIPEEALGAQGAAGGGGGGFLSGTAPSGVAGGAGSSRPQNNAQWLSQGVDVLLAQANPPSGADAYSALAKALDGKPLTQVEINMVSYVISRLGTPPEGMPPLAPAPPSGGGGGGGEPPPVGTRVQPKLNYNIYTWCSEIAGQYALPGFDFATMETLNPGIRSYIKWLPAPTGSDAKIPIFYRTVPNGGVRIR